MVCDATKNGREKSHHFIEIPGRRIALTSKLEETSDRGFVMLFGLPDVPTGVTFTHNITSTMKEQNVRVLSGDIWHRLNGIFLQPATHVFNTREHSRQKLRKPATRGGNVSGPDQSYHGPFRCGDISLTCVSNMKHCVRIYFD